MELPTKQQITNAIDGWFTRPSKLPTVDDILSSYILIDTETHNKGIGGYRFTQMRDDEIEIGSNITDYVVESGMTIQDAIQLKPLRLKLSGLAAEVSYGESKILTPIDNLINGFKPVLSLVPSLGNATQKVYDQLKNTLGEFHKLETQINNIIGIWSDNKSYKQGLEDWYANLMGSVQQKAFQQLYSKWKARELMDVETPWGVIKGLVIENVVIKQLSRSNTYSEIDVTLKQLTFASSQTLGGTKSTVEAGRRNGQIAETDSGQTGSGSTEEEIYVDGHDDGLLSYEFLGQSGVEVRERAG